MLNNNERQIIQEVLEACKMHEKAITAVQNKTFIDHSTLIDVRQGLVISISKLETVLGKNVEKNVKIILDCGLKLTINTETGNGSITSSLKEPGTVKTSDERHEWDTAMDAIESLVLAHACAGVDVKAPAYQKGLETSLEAITNNL